MSNEEFKWDSSLALGIPLMDKEHKELISRMRRVADFNKKTYDKEQLILAYEDLLSYTRQHFQDEEDHMLQIGYPRLNSHKRIHDSFLTSLEKYEEELKGSVYRRFPSSVFDFFKTWITTHIMIVDRQYLDYQNGNQKDFEAEPF